MIQVHNMKLICGGRNVFLLDAMHPAIIWVVNGMIKGSCTWLYHGYVSILTHLLGAVVPNHIFPKSPWSHAEVCKISE